MALHRFICFEGSVGMIWGLWGARYTFSAGTLLSRTKLTFLFVMDPQSMLMGYFWPRYCAQMCPHMPIFDQCAHSGPHLQNEHTPETWAYSHFYTKPGIFQYGHEW